MPAKAMVPVEAFPCMHRCMARSYNGAVPSRNRAANRDNRASAIPIFSRLCAVSTR